MMAAQPRVPALESDPVGRGGVKNGAEPSGSTVGVGVQVVRVFGVPEEPTSSCIIIGTSWLCLGVWGPSWSLGLVVRSPLHPTLPSQAVYLEGGRLRVLLHVQERTPSAAPGPHSGGAQPCPALAACGDPSASEAGGLPGSEAGGVWMTCESLFWGGAGLHSLGSRASFSCPVHNWPLLSECAFCDPSPTAPVCASSLTGR